METDLIYFDFPLTFHADEPNVELSAHGQQAEAQRSAPLVIHITSPLFNKLSAAKAPRSTQYITILSLADTALQLRLHPQRKEDLSGHHYALPPKMNSVINAISIAINRLAESILGPLAPSPSRSGQQNIVATASCGRPTVFIEMFASGAIRLRLSTGGNFVNSCSAGRTVGRETKAEKEKGKEAARRRRNRRNAGS